MFARRSFAFAAILTMAGCQSAARREAGPFRVGLWHWHSPYSAAPADVPIDDIFVRAATISFDGDRWVTILPQRFTKSDRRPLVLVFNVDAGARAHFSELDDAALLETLVTAYDRAKSAAARSGANVVGLQLDFDCPTRLLPKYAHLAQSLRDRIGRSTKFSITGLASWIGSSALFDLVRPLDEFDPQFYEGQLPKEWNDDIPVSDHQKLTRVAASLRTLPTPVRIGIAAYGQALLFNAAGHQTAVYRGLSVADAFRHPLLRLDSIRDVQGERHVRFRAIRADAQGRGQGFGILFRIPTSESLRAALAEVKRNGFAGAVVYRAPQEGEASSLPWETLQAVLSGRATGAEARLQRGTKQDVFGMIEGNAARPSSETRISVKNVGNAPRLADLPLTVTARFRPGCGEAVLNGESDGAVPIGPEGEGHVSLSRASGVRFRRFYLAPGKQYDLGSVRLGEGCPAPTVELKQ